MKFWQALLTQLQQHKKVYLLTVIQNSGSSPGRMGFKMLVAEDGYIFGSIGGGVMEFRLIEEAKSLLHSEKPPIFLKKQIHKGSGLNGSGMICSGEQTVVFHPLNEEHLPLITEISNSLKANQRRTLSWLPTGLQWSEQAIQHKFSSSIQSETDWSFCENIGFVDTIYIVGGGHVGLAVSKLFSYLHFKVVVFDNRENLNTFESNTVANQKEIVDYHQIENYIPQGLDSFVVIMTNKYTDDKIVLSKLIRRNYAFLGVLGSKAKLKTMWEVMQQEGYSNDALNKVFAPIGLPIKSQTPEEIAVSIAAQIIQVKNATL